MTKTATVEFRDADMRRIGLMMAGAQPEPVHAT